MCLIFILRLFRLQADKSSSRQCIRVQIHKALDPNADTKTINIPLAPVVNAIADAVSINEGAVGIALNGVEIYGPYNADTCCDFAADSLEKVDFCMGYSSATYPSYRSSS